MSNTDKEDTKSQQQIIIKDKNSGFMGMLPGFIKAGIAIGMFSIVLITFSSAGKSPDAVSYETKFESYNEYFNGISQAEKSKKDTIQYKKNMYLIDFVGSPSGNEVEQLRRNIDFVLVNSRPGDEVALRLTSPGGSVMTYGLAASELARLKSAGLNLTTLVDTVAASGGYMMASVSDKVLAAPFAFVGSIGVVAQIPIYEDLLKNLGVEFKVYTAGESKRSVVPQIKPTEEDEMKLKHDLEKIHAQFKGHIKKNRPAIDIEKVSTGQVFSGQDALDLKLIDEISTSSDYLLKQHLKNTRITYVFTDEIKKNKARGLSSSINSAIDHFTEKLVMEVKKEVYNPYQHIQ